MLAVVQFLCSALQLVTGPPGTAAQQPMARTSTLNPLPMVRGMEINAEPAILNPRSHLVLLANGPRYKVSLWQLSPCQAAGSQLGIHSALKGHLQPHMLVRSAKCRHEQSEAAGRQ